MRLNIFSYKAFHINILYKIGDIMYSMVTIANNTVLYI